MGRGRDPDRPVEPREARAHGNDADAVRVEHENDRDGTRTETSQTGSGRETGGVRRASEGRRDRGGDGTDSLAWRDSARWGPIWAGLITALTIFLLLQLLAIGLGLIGIGPNNTGGAWVSTILGLIAFFVGGAVSGMTSAVRGAVPGLINGFLVWALGTVLILLLSALGLGQIFGALGNVVGQVGVLQSIQQGSASAPNVDPSQVASAVRTGALGAFFGLLLAAVSAMIGGLIGGGPREPVGHMARDSNS